MEKTWLKQYPAGVPANIDVEQYPSLVALLEESLKRYASLPAYKFMGKAISFAQVDEASRALAAYLQSLGLAKGDRVAIMMPNVPQYPVAVAAILRAGYVVVNVNPLYTPRELEHQLKDSGAKVMLMVENFATTMQQVINAVPTKKVIVTALGDMLGFPKSLIVNYVVRKVKKMVPAFDLPGAVKFNDALSQGRGKTFKPAQVGPDDIAVLQYTGGTTGVSKGAVLLHRNLVANILQAEAWYQPALKKIPKGEQINTVCALPIYHIFGFNTNMMLSMRMGGCNILIANPRDLPGVFKDLAREKFHSFPAVNTLFNAMANHPDFGTVDWSSLVISVGGGMAVQSATAKLWLEKTGCPIVEGYGLSETSPSATCNPVDSTAYSGNIGLPMPNTELTLLDDDGREVPLGTPGEIAIRGPQVMAGYWQRPDETAKVMTVAGFLRTGDIGPMDERGYRLWNNVSNDYGWRSYLGVPPGSDGVSGHASPARCEDLTGLPPAWVGVGTLDLFLDEDLAYAGRLRSAGVPCRVEVVEGAFHAFDYLAPSSSISRRFRDSQLESLAAAFRSVHR